MSIYIPLLVTIFSFIIVTFVVCRRLNLRTNYLSRHFTTGPIPALEMNVWHWYIYFILVVIFVLVPTVFAWGVWLSFQAF